MTDSKDATEVTRAAILDHGFMTLVAELEISIVDQMVADFRAGKLTHEAAIAHVAKLTHMKDMQNIIEHRARKEIAKASKERNHG